MSHVIGRGRYARETYPKPPAAGGGSVGCQSAVVFSPDPPCTPTTSIRSDRSAHQSPITGSPVGATNLGSDTTGTSTGVSGDYGTVSGGDQNTAALFGTVVGGVACHAATAAVAGGDAAEGVGIGSVAFGIEPVASGQSSTATGLSSVASGDSSVAMGAGANASGTASVAIGDAVQAGAKAYFFTIAPGGTLVTIAGSDATGDFVNGDTVKIAPETPTVLASVVGALASPPVFALGDTTFNLAAPNDAATTGGVIADTSIGADACAVGGTENAAVAAESFIGGGRNNRVEVAAVAGKAGGVLAQAIRPTQDAWSSGSDGTLGHLQTSKLVVSGTTPGTQVGQSTDLLVGGATFFELEDGKAYAIRLHVIATGKIGGVRVTQSFEVEVTADRDAGLSDVSAANVIVQQGDAGGATWTMAATVGAGPDRLRFTFGTGATQVAANVAARVEWTEVFSP